MNLRPFDLAQAKAGAAVYDRTGIPAREWHYFQSAAPSARIGAVFGNTVRMYHESGQYLSSAESQFDLMIDEPVRQGFIAVLRSDSDSACEHPMFTFHETEDEARAKSQIDGITLVEVQPIYIKVK